MVKKFIILLFLLLYSLGFNTFALNNNQALISKWPKQVILDIDNTQSANGLLTISNVKSFNYENGHQIRMQIADSATLLHVLKILGTTHYTIVDNRLKCKKLLEYYTNENDSSKLLAIVSLGVDTDSFHLLSIFEFNGIHLETAQPFKKYNKYIVSGGINQLFQLANNINILKIEPYKYASPLNFYAEGLTGARLLNASNLNGGYGLLGDSIVVGVGDNSSPNHIDIIDRQLASFCSINQSYHAFHTTGTVVGGGLVDEFGRGFAPNAKVINDFFDLVLTNAPYYQSKYGLQMTNNSYAAIVGNCNYMGKYDAISAFIDQQLNENPNLLHIFAAGNDGGLTCGTAPAGYRTLESSYQSAKNDLVVANFQKDDSSIWYSSSKGPTEDGRIKPEITAVGTSLYSTFSGNGYVYSNGTSMSTPNVTGGSVLLAQRYKQLYNGALIPNALLKSILVNGADDILLPGPDYASGFGAMNLKNSINILNNHQYLNDSILTSADKSFSITIPNNTDKAKILLYWNDKEAIASVGNTLINDLDLTVVDPTGTVSLPLVPNPDSLTSPATQRADHLNNIEQITLNKPSAGNYTVHVRGYNVPSGPQQFWLSYSFIKDSISLKFPLGGERLVSGVGYYIYWNAPNDNEQIQISYSTDGGANWISIIDGLSSQTRSYNWTIPNDIKSDKCIVKVTSSTGETVNSGIFTIVGRPTIQLAPTVNQCPGSILLQYDSVANVNKYYAYKKVGGSMVLVDSTFNLQYRFSGLNPDSSYLVSMAAAASDGHPGVRAYGIITTPNNGQCIGVAHGDLSIAHITPNSGRRYTSSQLSNNQNVRVLVKNLDNQANTGFKVYLKINNNSWDSVTVNNTLNTLDSTWVVFAENLLDTGIYNISAVVKNTNLQDPNNLNDSFKVQIQQLPNEPIDLNSNSYTETFESFPTDYLIVSDQLGLAYSNRWDFVTNTQGFGRVRAYVHDSVTINNAKSLSIDQLNYSTNAAAAFNQLLGTFNLATLQNDTNGVARFDFNYRLAANPHEYAQNYIALRGSDSSPWIIATYLDTTNIGTVKNTTSISISDLLNQNNQSFSTSTQIGIFQKDSSMIANSNVGNGLTIDNFKLYKVVNDAEILSMDSIPGYNCGLSAQYPIKVKLVNRMGHTLHNISVGFAVDNNTAISESIDSISALDTIDYVFTHTADLSNPGLHLLNIWVKAAGDNYSDNDTLKNIEINTLPLITDFPYLENFEQNNGNYYSAGINNTWQYGTPKSYAVDHAASGTHVWKTNLTGNYQNNSTNYLYSPCFDISELSHPYLSFSLNYSIEATDQTTGAIYDQGFVEYSLDNGVNWQKLGATGEGFNWYNIDSADIWAGQSINYWKGATIPLPIAQHISLRWVLKSDQGTTYDGIALDDVHVYDSLGTIFNADSLTSPAQITASNSFETILQSSAVVAQLNSESGSYAIQDYLHADYITKDSQQYFLPRNYVITKTGTAQPTIRFFVKDTLMEFIRNDSLCSACPTNKEIYNLGITRFKENDFGTENNSLYDDSNGVFSFFKKDSVQWVPYLDGYYAQIQTDTMGEFWFNDGGPSKKSALTQDLLEFDAVNAGTNLAKATWSNQLDYKTLRYALQRAGNAYSFVDIANVNSVRDNDNVYEYVDSPYLDAPWVKYRLKYFTEDGSVFYSPIKIVTFDNIPSKVFIYPNPVGNNGILNVDWFKLSGADMTWQIFNVTGQKVSEGVFDQNNYKGTGAINLNQLAITHGIYILSLHAGAEHWKFKIVY